MNRSILAKALVAVAFVSQAGCLSLTSFMNAKRPQLDTSLLEAQGYSIPPGGMPTYVDQQSGSGKPQVVLEIRGAENARHMERVPLPMDKAVFVEDIVQQAKLHEQFGQLSIAIMRPSAGGAPPIRLDVRTDKAGKAGSVGSNYALLPGDHLVIIEDNRSSFEKYITSQFGR